ncbi:Hypothetical protein GLP15_2412 [Giardia lamblia P15]|uniref:Uncharacterized protein n=1 Tax=Giardia intestinalis (strain P15) TaxID=658858 RepID=E1EZ03_GIAIA|nr:Hypothetical protein GLP15_2412 [Giardia lamblia P15]
MIKLRLEDSKSHNLKAGCDESADGLDHTEDQSAGVMRSSPFAVPYPTKADASVYKYLCYLEFLLRLQRRCHDSQEVEAEIHAVLSTKGPIVRGCSLLHIRTMDSLVRRLKSFFIDFQNCYDAITLVGKELFVGDNIVCPQVDRDELLSSFYVLIGLLNERSSPVYLEEIYYSIWGLVRQIDGTQAVQDAFFTERNALVSILQELYVYVKQAEQESTTDLPSQTEKPIQHLLDATLRKRLLEQLIHLYKTMYAQVNV